MIFLAFGLSWCQCHKSTTCSVFSSVKNVDKTKEDEKDVLEDDWVRREDIMNNREKIARSIESRLITLLKLGPEEKLGRIFRTYIPQRPKH